MAIDPVQSISLVKPFVENVQRVPSEYPGQTRDGSPSSQSGEPQDDVQISAEAQQKIAQLQQTDQEVRAHEAAHMAAGGGLVKGGASYEYTTGPDGRRYAVAGEVTLDASKEQDPAATLAKAQRLQAAALAPADPSPQDRAVAAQAASMASQASAELAQQKRTDTTLDIMA